MTDRNADMFTMVVHGTHGIMPKHIRRMVETRGISLEDYRDIGEVFGTDWQAMREFILDNLTGNKYKSPFH